MLETHSNGANGKSHDAPASISTLPLLAVNGDRAGEVRQLVTRLLQLLGEDPSRQGLLLTPKRVEESLRFLTSGYAQDVDTVINGALYDAPKHAGMVTFQDIGFSSLCEHHLLPFFGTCYVAYLPGDKVVGLSKVPRIVKLFSRRLQLQERLTSEVAETLEKTLHPMGVAVATRASHMCIRMRGVEETGSTMLNTVFLGAFEKDPVLRREFLDTVVNARRERQGSL